MLKTIYATVEGAVISSPSGIVKSAKSGSLRNFEFEERPGYLYVAVRAVSSRVNKNYDAFTEDELKKAYKTFEGRPVFVNHNNTDTRRARGVILMAKLHEDAKETWVELLLEMDAITFPLLCAAIQNGDIDTVSMGCNIDYSICSVCGNKARFATEYCLHTERKGSTFPVVQDDGSTLMVMAFEYCYGVNFFEISWVFDPADTSAIVQGIMKESKAAMVKVAAKEIHAPEPVDTLHAVGACPQCGNDNWDGMVCDVCGYANEPESLSAPDTDVAKEQDLPVERIEPEMVAETEVFEDVEVPAWSLDEREKKPSAWSLDERKNEPQDEVEDDGDDEDEDGGVSIRKDGSAMRLRKEQIDVKPGDRVYVEPNEFLSGFPITYGTVDAEGGIEWDDGTYSHGDKDSPSYWNDGTGVKKAMKGGSGMTRRSEVRHRIAQDLRRRWAQTGEEPDAAPASTAVDTSADQRVDVTDAGGIAPASDADTTTTVETPGVEVVVDDADTTTEVTGDDTVPVAEVNEVVLPVAVDPGDAAKTVANPPALPEQSTPGATGEEAVETGQMQPLDSVTGNKRISAMTVLTSALRLAEVRQNIGLEPKTANLSVLASRFASQHSLSEIRAMTRVLSEVQAKSAVGNRGTQERLVPRRERKRTAGLSRTRTASKTPDEAIFG